MTNVRSVLVATIFKAAAKLAVCLSAHNNECEFRSGQSAKIGDDWSFSK
jgi:hypothetical protein